MHFRQNAATLCLLIPTLPLLPPKPEAKVTEPPRLQRSYVYTGENIQTSALTKYPGYYIPSEGTAREIELDCSSGAGDPMTLGTKSFVDLTVRESIDPKHRVEHFQMIGSGIDATYIVIKPNAHDKEHPAIFGLRATEQGRPSAQDVCSYDAASNALSDCSPAMLTPGAARTWANFGTQVKAVTAYAEKQCEIFRRTTPADPRVSVGLKPRAERRTFQKTLHANLQLLGLEPQ